MSRNSKPGKILDFGGTEADKLRLERREAKAKDIRQRFAAACRTTESKSRAAGRLKKLFKKPPRNP